MKTDLSKWLTSMEEAKEINQSGGTPDEDFSVVDNELGGDVDTAKPAVAKIEPEEADGEGDVPESDEMVDGDVSVSEEGFLGGVTGFLLGLPGYITQPLSPLKSVNVGLHVNAKIYRENLKREIHILAKRIEKLRNGDIDEAKQKGIKLPKRSATANWKEIIKAAVLGATLGPIYGARQGSQIQDLNKELAAKIKELKEELRKAGLEVKMSEKDRKKEEKEKAKAAKKASKEDYVDIDPEVVEILEQQDEVVEDIDRFGKISDALEAYASVLQSSIDRGTGVSPDAIVAIQIGMEALDTAFIDSPIATSLEDFEEDFSRLSATEVSLESLKENASKIYEAVKRAIKRLFDFLHDIWVKATGGAKRALERAKKLDEHIDSFKASHVKGTITITGAGSLTVDNTFVGNYPSAVNDIKQVAKDMYEDYPKRLERFANTLIKAYHEAAKVPSANNQAIGRFAAITLNNVKDVVRPPAGHVPAKAAELPSEYSTSANVRSPILPGGRAMVSSVKKIAESDGSLAEEDPWNILISFSKVFKVEFVRLENHRPVESEVVKIPSKQELSIMVKQIMGLLDYVIKSVNKQPFREVKKFVDKHAGGHYTNAFIETFKGQKYESMLHNATANMLTHVSKLATQPSGSFTGYVVSTCNAFLSVLQRNVDAYEAQAAAG